MALLLVFFAVSIVFSFLCSMWEASLLTIPPSYVETQSQTGSRFGQKLKAYKTDVDRPLSAILTLNTIAHTVGAIGVGAQATKVWPGNELMTGAVVPVVMTLAILILSEIIPKTWGATRWKALAPFTIKCLSIVQTALLPLVWLSEQITKGMKGKGHATTITRTDLAALATLSEREGQLDSAEGKVMANLLQMKEVKVHDVMTPRTVIHAAPESTTVRQYLSDNVELPFSRIPLFGKTRDQMARYVLKDDLLLAAYRDNDGVEMGSLARPLTTFTQDSNVSVALDRLLSGKEHIGLVLDEFGGTAGIVTQEDIIETLLGLEIVDESDRNEDMQALARKISERRRRAAVQSASVGAQGRVDLDGATPTLGLTGQQVPVDDSGNSDIAR